MKTIRKHFATMKAAERFQARLYSNYWSVKLVNFPRFEEAGTYVWEVE